MLLLDLLLVDEQEALEVMRTGPVEDRPLPAEVRPKGLRCNTPTGSRLADWNTLGGRTA